MQKSGLAKAFPDFFMKLTLHINQGFQQFIGNCNNFGIGLIATLGNNHICQLAGHIYIGHFQRRWSNGTAKITSSLNICPLARHFI